MDQEENQESLRDSLERLAEKDRQRRELRRRQRNRWLLFLGGLLLTAAVFTVVFVTTRDRESGEADAPFYIPEEEKGNDPPELPAWVEEDLLPVNKYSRPGTALKTVNGVVVHYVGNPGTTAKQNRNYFANLAETHETSASSHFIIDTDGTVLLCVPLSEISYCSNKRNADTIAIECCHPDESGEFTEAELETLTKLLKLLAEAYDLKREDVIRHYDVTGKECPRYYVQNPEAWEKLLDGVFEPET